MKSILFAVVVVRHKWYVFVEGLRLGGIPLWNLIVHDISKFHPHEWNGYVKGFLCERHVAESMPDVCDAWMRHRKRNKHHWEYWIMDDGIEPMPYVYVREMVADWFAAMQTYDTGGRDITPFLKKHVHVMHLHEETHQHLYDVLAEVGIDWDEITKTKSSQNS